jgi:folate-dependent phosphoribosylglycinamide formyltransferase PurN
MNGKRLVLLATPGEATNISFNALRAFFPPTAVVFERFVPRTQFLRSRAKRLGWGVVAGQLLFFATILPWLRKTSRRRSAQILRDFSLKDAPIPESEITHVDSINSARAILTLQALKPDIVFLCGTRILAPRVLEQVPATFINIHSGITPLYRGVHGGYWALARGEPQACGVTVHLVDKGIDSGGILAQSLIAPGPKDCFVTYPLLQLGVGLQLLPSVLARIASGEKWTLDPPPGRSALWSHPTLFQYANNFWRRRVK